MSSRRCGRPSGAASCRSCPGVAAGAAYAADALGFLDPQEPVAVRQAGPWWRLSTSRGHVLVRAALALADRAARRWCRPAAGRRG